MPAGRGFLRASMRDAIIKDQDDRIWNGSTFRPIISVIPRDAIRFKSLKQAKQVASHLKKIIPGSNPRAKRATYPEQAAFGEEFSAIEIDEV
jgi:hypothetical protein